MAFEDKDIQMGACACARARSQPENNDVLNYEWGNIEKDGVSARSCCNIQDRTLIVTGND